MHRRLLCCIVGCLVLYDATAFGPTTTPFLQGGLVSRHPPLLAHAKKSLADAAADNGDMVDASHLERRKFLAQSFIFGVLPLMPADVALADDGNDNHDTQTTNNTIIDPSINMPKITSKVYLDIQYANFKQPKRIVIGLFGDVMPKTAQNFLTLCTNNDGPTYAGTLFYRVISDTSIQGGAIGKDVNSGKSGTTSFDNGTPFDPDNYSILHSKKGLLSAVRNADGTIDSRFFIQTEEDAGWADGRYAAFGIVLEEGGTGGMELVKKISRVDVKTPQNSPKEPVSIVACGLL